MFRRIKIGATTLAVLIGVWAPAFWLGQYVSDQKNLDDKERLKATIEYQAESQQRALREQRDQLYAEKAQEIDRIMLMCRAAATEAKQATSQAKQATESAKGVLDTVKETKDAQIDTIRETLQKVKK